MVIISDKNSEILVKIPNNFKKNEDNLILRHTETKKEYTIEFTDTYESDYFFIFTYTFSEFPVGEYEYTIGENKGLLRIEDKMNKKVYDAGITFKTYES